MKLFTYIIFTSSESMITPNGSEYLLVSAHQFLLNCVHQCVIAAVLFLVGFFQLFPSTGTLVRSKGDCLPCLSLHLIDTNP
jgi:hypothetical protein